MLHSAAMPIAQTSKARRILRHLAQTLLAWLSLITLAHAQFAPAVTTVREYSVTTNKRGLTERYE